MNLQDAIALFIGGIAGYAQQGNYSLGTAIYKVISLIFIGLYVVPLLMYIVNVPSEYSVGVYALLGYLSIEVLVTIKKVFPIITQAVTDKVTGKTRLEYVGPDIKISNDKIGKKKKHKKNIKFPTKNVEKNNTSTFLLKLSTNAKLLS